MVRLFELKAGECAALVIDRIGVHRADGGVMVDRKISVTAVATDDFKTIAGTRRRRFTDVQPPIDRAGSDVWMADEQVP